jgi:archaellum component FlaG (FlaF/FlaG flagellin family)
VKKAQGIVIYALVASVLLVSAVAALLAEKTIHGGGSIKAVGLEVYWDPACTNVTSTLDFGQMEPGSTTEFTLYLRNEGNSALTLQLTTENWTPVTAPDYLTLTWNREGQQITPTQVLDAVITLSAADNVEGIASFSLDIVISGTG